jgi:hypothetical protein
LAAEQFGQDIRAMKDGDTPFPRLREVGDRGLHSRGRDDPSRARHAGAILRVEIDADG